MSKAHRITITVSEEILAQWQFFNNRESLSAFIRDALDAYISEMDKSKQKSETFNHLVQRNAQQIQRIEEDLIEIQAVLAKNEIIPDLESDTRIIQFIEQRMAGTDVTLEDKRILARIKQRFK